MDPEDDTSWTLDYASGQFEATEVAVFHCRAQYPPKPQFYQPVNRAQAHAWYDHLVGEASICLTGLGYDVSPPPSKDTWVAQFEARSADLRQPFHDPVPSDSYDDARRACPEFPEDFYDLATRPGSG